MRLHSLDITAFGPFGTTQEIDFDALSADGIFLLHGPTGAGKTSVLDAVCYALYGAVPGARQSPGASLRSDHAPHDLPTEVRLELTVGGRRLEVTRRPAQPRPKKKGTGFTTEKAQSWLREYVPDTGWKALSRSHQEIGEEITQLVGMSREQFCQVVLLPQGDFARFLRADAEARGKLLGRLFDTRRFAAVEERLAELRRAAEQQVRAGDERLLAVAQRMAQAAGDSADARAWPLPDAQPGEPGLAEAVREWAAIARSGARERLDIAESAVAAAGSRRAAARRTLEDERELAALQQRYADARRRADVLEARRPEYERLRERHERARRAERVAPALSLRDDAEREHRAASGARERSRAELPADLADTGAEQLAALERTLRQDLGGLEAARRAERRSEEIGRERAALERQARDDDELLRDAADWLGGWDATRRRCQERIEAAQDAVTRAEHLAGKLEPARRRLDAARRRDVLAEQVTTAEDRLRAVRDGAAAAHERWLDLKERRLRGIAAELAAGLRDGEACAVCGSQEHPQPARAAADQVDRTAEEAAYEAHTNAEAARGRAERALAAVREDHAAARAEARGSDADSAPSEATRPTARTGAGGAGTASHMGPASGFAAAGAGAGPAGGAASAAVPSPTSSVEDPTGTAAARQDASGARTGAADDRGAAGAGAGAGDGARGASGFLGGVAGRSSGRDGTGTAGVGSGVGSGVGVEAGSGFPDGETGRTTGPDGPGREDAGAMEASRGAGSSSPGGVAGRSAGLDGPTGDGDAGARLEGSQEAGPGIPAQYAGPAAESDPMDEACDGSAFGGGTAPRAARPRDVSVHELASLVEELRREHATARTTAAGLHAAREALDRAEREYARRVDAQQQAERRAAARTSQREALDREQASLEAELTAARGEARSVAEHAALLERRVRVLGEAAEAVRAVEATAQRLKEAHDRVADAAFKAGFDTPHAAAQALLGEAEQRDLQHRIDDWQREQAAVADRLAEPETAAAARRPQAVPQQAQAEFDAAERQLLDAASALDAARERSAALAALSQQAAEETRRLGPLREQYERVARLASLTAGTSADNERKMRLESYVLAARLEQVAAAATARLQRMSSGRYTLVHSDARSGGRGRSGLGLHVVDAWTGIERDTATLSGGETFFASLALALGLADVVTDEAGGVRLDTLFIDEGFGSLDDQTLDEVLDVLDSLRERDRSVGIVSHVADLRRRVTTQLEVVKDRHGSVVRHRTAFGQRLSARRGSGEE
ncbi:AAA family ATPase [Streptomyces sp. ISL-99]|uniref:AAA family ATPase n=1 Tax=Streptomyces sp. ISL-99 TaxID=2819193 RepID=UPI001BEC1318|nr:AAA family ATPase [Streptomyces sp. ISL-99]MBT2529717.1 AAA family ATPase [Streptomyces sp. ISL-99]